MDNFDGNDITTERMIFPGTTLECFGFTGLTKGLIMTAFCDALRDHGDPPGPPEFPGPQPISIDIHTHFQSIRENDYAVATKTDGVRACAFFYDIAEGVHLISLFSRKMDQPYGIFVRNTPNVFCQGYGTILDGEIVLDTTTNQWTFLIFDAVALCSFPQFHKSFFDRLYSVSTALNLSYKYSPGDTVRLEVKNFVNLEQAPTRGEDLHDKRFKQDGFVFMPMRDQIVFGHHKSFYKLKTTHSVDFLYKEGYLHVFNSTTKRYVRAGVIDNPTDEYPDGVILECDLVEYANASSKRRWRVLMPRSDKDKSNSLFVLDKTLLNIKENLSYEKVRSLKQSRIT
jgi:hypothetical protein